MNTFHNTRLARAARFIAQRLENENEVHLTIPTEYADSRIWRIMCYLNKFCGKYWIEYPNNNTAIVRKQG